MYGKRFSMDYGPVLPGEAEVWRDESVYRMSVGYYLNTAGLVAGMIVGKGCPLAVDFKTQTATPVKNVRVVAAVADGGTAIKISKDSLVKVGDFISDGTTTAAVTAIDKSNTAFDTLTVGSSLGAIAVGTVLFETADADSKEPKNKANKLNYRRTHIDGSGAKITVTAVGRVFEIKNSLLLNPCSDADKASLGDLFMFID